MVSAKESFEPDQVYCANSQLRESAQAMRTEACLTLDSRKAEGMEVSLKPT